MNIADLRAALREQASVVVDQGAVLRVEQVHARVRRVRRRRVAGAAALTVGALAVVSTVSLLPDRAAPATAPVENFVSHSGEYDLITASMGVRGQNTLSLTVPAPDGEVHFSMACYGVSGAVDGYWVSGWVGDTRPVRPASFWCGGDPAEPIVPGVHGAPPGPWSYGNGLTVDPADDTVTVHLELTKEVDGQGRPLDSPDEMGDYVRVASPSVVLGVGAYAVAAPITTAVGTPVPPKVGIDGRDYRYEGHMASEPGERELVWELPASTQERYFDVFAVNAPELSGVDMSVDGGCRSNSGLTAFRTGGCLLSPGSPHTITVTVVGEVPAEVELAIVLYAR